MCGIAGIVDLSDRPIDPGSVQRMCDTMARRGPDAGEIRILPHAVLGHRRLAILDLSERGNQPMTARGLWAVHNGEIYNHAQLRRELEERGARYFSTTDTESLLYGYDDWRTGLSRRCRGMWAFAIWDGKERTLHLSRDRMGEKPLYYWVSGTRFAFCSSIAGLTQVVPRVEVDPAAVASLLAYEYIPHEECILQGVRKLAPAHHLVFNDAGVVIERYWKLDYRTKLEISVDEAVGRVEELVDSAVGEQLRADVPVGVFLSGGVDSGYVAALASRHQSGITAITMTVPGSDDRDESANARAIAALHSISGVEVPLDENCIRDLPMLLATIEPFGDSSIIPAAAVARAASRQLKVVLTGDGGDEGFGGYGLPQIARQAAGNGTRGRLAAFIAPALRALSRQWITPGLRLLRLHSSRSALLAGGGIEAFLQAREATPVQVRNLLYGPALEGLLHRPLAEHLLAVLKSSLAADPWDALLSIGIECKLADDFLYKVDSATMFHSLEARCPLLDHRLHEFLAQLPFHILMPDTEYKSLLKRAAVRHNPKEVVHSRKKGFSIPVERYFLGGWGRLLLNLTRDGAAAQRGLIKPEGVRQYLSMHGLRANYRLDRQLFSLLALELWLRVFLEKRESPESLGECLLRGMRN
jgi:asparagine synthase (glutamine-hydrolysing)